MKESLVKSNMVPVRRQNASAHCQQSPLIVAGCQQTEKRNVSCSAPNTPDARRVALHGQTDGNLHGDNESLDTNYDLS